MTEAMTASVAANKAVDFVLWPEAALPLSLESDAYLSRLTGLSKVTDTPLVIGALDRRGAGYGNAVAVIKADLGNLPAISIGDTSKVRVGDVVLAIGNPFGVGQTVTMGIVSALGRSQLGVSAFENFVQTDAAINPGNSGGALIDIQGNLIGINTVIFSRSGGSQGIGFAIPAETVRQVMDQLIAYGKVVRGWLGVETQDLTRTLAESFGIGPAGGALIAGVVRGGPAEEGGIRPGDVVVAIEGKPVGDSSALLNAVAALKPGSSAAVTLVRERKELKVTVKVGTRPARRRG